VAGRRTGLLSLLCTRIASLRGERVRYPAKTAASAAGVTAQVSPWLATISAGTEIAAGLASNTVSPEEFCRVTDEVRTTPVILPVSRAALAAAVDPWLVPTSQTGLASRERAKSMARSIAAA